MNSKQNPNLEEKEERIKKATDILTKSWWFCFYLIIAPIIVALITFLLLFSFIIFYFFTKDENIRYVFSFAFSCLAYMLSLLFFYKAFDKFRKKPYFKNLENNLSARINVLFLITISSLVVTPLFIYITPEDYAFELLPLTSFIILYNIIWYYYFYQPIDYYDDSEGKFKYIHDLKASIKQWHNLIIIVNYIVQIIFLALIFYTEFSWLYALITNIVFYLLTSIYTRNQKLKIKIAINEKKSLFLELKTFQKKFVISVISLIFCFLIQLPLIILAYSLPQIQYMDVEFIFSLLLIALFVLFYFKARLYIFFQYSFSISRFTKVKDIDDSKKIISEKFQKFQKFNSSLSIVLIGIIISFSFLLDILPLILIILPFFYILFYYEEKAKFYDKKQNRYNFLLNTLAILLAISFGILPIIWIGITWNIQLIILLITLYFILEIFVRQNYFDKEDVIVIQNILAIASFLLIAFSFYPIIIVEYLSFTSEPILIYLVNFLLTSLLSLTTSIIFLYILYARYFHKKLSKTFKLSVIINFILIELFIFALIYFRLFFLVEFNIFFNALIISTVILPAIFILFLFFNYLLGLFSVRTFLNYCYYTFYFLIFSSFISIIILFYDFSLIILLDLLLLSILMHYQLKFGSKLEKIKETTFSRFIIVNSYLVSIELFILFFNLFNSILFLDMLLSSFFSLCLICILVSIFSKMENIFSESIKTIIIECTLLYFTFLTFYYSFILLFGSFYVIVIPIIISTSSFFLPYYYAFKKKILKLSLLRKIAIINFLMLSSSIISIPTIIGLELVRLGLSLNIGLVINSTVLIFFGFLSILSIIAPKIQLKEIHSIYIKTTQILTWFSISILASIQFNYTFIDDSSISFNYFILSSSFLIFFLLNFFNLKLFENLNKQIRELRDAKLNSEKCYKFLINFQNFVFYGIVFSLSYEIATIIHMSNLLYLLPSDLEFLNILWYLGFFFSSILILTRFSKYVTDVEFSRVKNILEIISWFYVKIIACVFFAIYAFPFSIINKIFLFSLIFCVLTPISVYYFGKFRDISEDNKYLIIKIISCLFLISLIVFYMELYWFFVILIPNFNENLIYFICIAICNLLLLSNFYMTRINLTIQKDSKFKLYSFFGSSLILFASMLYFIPEISVVLLIVSCLILFSQRNKNFIIKIVSYFLLSLIGFMEIQVILNIYNLLSGFDFIPVGFFILVYLASLIVVVLISVLINLRKSIKFEVLSLFTLISIQTFVFILTYTNVLLIYNITITFFIFFLFTGIYLRQNNDKRYKWFINPCILLAVFDFTSWISYSYLFTMEKYQIINPILTFTLTLSTTGFTFVFLYNKAPEKIRRQSFFTILTAVIISFPLFIYILFISYYPIPLEQPIPLIIAINIGIFLYYLSIGIYQWKISWAIWKTGWFIWIAIPIVNFILIYRIFTGIDVFTNSLNIFGVNSIYLFEVNLLSGPFILTSIIFVLFYLPVLYFKIRKYFTQIIIAIWAINLILVYWFSQNLFFGYFLLINSSFFLFAIILLMPIFYALKQWKILSIFWLILIGTNTIFLQILFNEFGVFIEISISMNILIVGLFLILYSFFPNIRSTGSVLIVAYSTVLLGIFLIIYFVLFAVLLNPLISINMAFLVIALSLFTSKYLKFNKKHINLLISWILIINLSWLTFNTFSLIPGLELFALFLALTIFGGSFFVFDHFKMIKPINKGIPLLILAFGTSSTISSVLFIFFQASALMICAIFTIISILFLYFMLEDYRFALWYLIPIPFSFLILDLLILIDIIQTVAILTYLILYIIIFQLIFNSVNSFIKGDKTKIENNLMKFYKNQEYLNTLNFGCFVINSSYISLFASIISRVILIQIFLEQLIVYYQILVFFTILSILMLFSMKYFKNKELGSKVKDLTLYLDKIGILLYLVFSIAIALDLLLIMILFNIGIINIIFLFILIFSGVVFCETFFEDKIYFDFLIKKSRNQLNFWSWFIFSNISCVYFYVFHLNLFLLTLTISLLNLISLSFLSKIGITKTNTIYESQTILIHIIYISLSFYMASVLSSLIGIVFKQLDGIPAILFFFVTSTFLIFVFSYFFIKIKTRLKNWIEFAIIIIFQVLFAIFFITVFLIFNILNLFTSYLILLIETCIFFMTVKYIHVLFIKKENTSFMIKAYSLLTLLFYFETSLMTFGLFNEFFEILESILISQIVLFTFSSFDIIYIKKIKQAYMYFIHAISYFTISLSIFLFLVQFGEINLTFFILNLLLFLAMQFYTNHALFKSFNKFTPSNIMFFNKWRKYIQNILGVAFYALLVVLTQNLLVFLDIQIQLLLLSLLVHGLMILDKYLLKFLNKATDYIRIISWIFIMIFSSTLFSWTYIFSITIIPLINFVLIFEIFYCAKLLEFFQFFAIKKDKIRFYLFNTLYFNFITWPFYFASLYMTILINLVLLSCGITFILTYVDEILKVINEKIRILLRKMFFLIIGGLISVDSFILFHTFFDLNLINNLNISLFILLIFIGILIKPFKKHSFKALLFWVATCVVLGFLTYFLSTSIALGGIFFVVLILIYPFVFLLEELRNFFNKFMDLLIEFYGRLKRKITNAYRYMVNFIKKYFKYIWITIMVITGISIFIFVLNYLWWVHSLLLSLVAFVLLSTILPKEETDDPNVMFKRKMINLISIWGGIIGLLFGFLPLEWYILVLWIGIWILGAVLLPFIIYKEKKENISIKWRFYTLISLIITLIIFGLLLYLQIAWLNA